MSSGIRKNWNPAVFPADPEAARRLQEWLASEDYNLNGMGSDFRGADLSGGDFSNAWFTDAVLVGVKFVSASFYRADLQSADLTGADLTGADCVRANLDEAVLRSARLDGADMVGASLCDVDASGASFRGTRFLGASLIDTDMRGRIWPMPSLMRISSRSKSTMPRWCGAWPGRFSARSPSSTERRPELVGGELEAWIAARGGHVQVIPSRRPPR